MKAKDLRRFERFLRAEASRLTKDYDERQELVQIARIAIWKKERDAGERIYTDAYLRSRARSRMQDELERWRNRSKDELSFTTAGNLLPDDDCFEMYRL